jgi:hypothetical protein
LYVQFRDLVGTLLDSWGVPETILPPNHNLELDDPKVAAGQGTTFVDWFTLSEPGEATFGPDRILRGSVIVNVWSQAGNTDKRALQLVDSLGDLFRGARDTAQGTWFGDSAVPNGYVPLDGYSMWPVEIEFIYQGAVLAPRVTRHPQAGHGFEAGDVPTVLEASGSTWVAAPTAWPWKSTVALLVGIVDDDVILVQEEPGPVPEDVSIPGTPGQDGYRSQGTAGAYSLFTPPAVPPAGAHQRLFGVLPSGRANWNPGEARLV